MNVFDLTAQIYDQDRAKLIPCFDELFGTALELIPEGTEHILDLGAGTGLLSRCVFTSGRFAVLFAA